MRLTRRFKRVLAAFKRDDEPMYAPSLVDRGVYQSAQPALDACDDMERAGLVRYAGINHYRLTNLGRAEREKLRSSK